MLTQLLRTFPHGWASNEISIVGYKDTDRPMDYGGTSGSALADCSVSGGGKSKIYFYSPAREETLLSIAQSIEHEIGHANDWNSDNEMTALERAQLILSVYARVISADRFRSSYVESISEKDPKLNRYNRAVEYWAEICRQYFTDYTQLCVKDYKLVDSQVRKTDKKFDVAKAEKALAQIIGPAITTYGTRGYATKNQN